MRNVKIQVCKNMRCFRRVLQKKLAQKEKRKRRLRENLRIVRHHRLKSLVFITQKPWVNLSLVLGCGAMAIQPRVSGWSAKDINKISGPLAV